MPKALVPIDGLQISLCAVRHAIEHDEPFSPLGRHRRFASRRFPTVAAVCGIFQHA